MGKHGKRRQCPAAGREISSGECGEKRNAAYACPADCSHNPFGSQNYDHQLEVEAEVERATVAWLVHGDPVRGGAPAVAWPMASGDRGLGLHAEVVAALLFRRDGEGLTSAERWERAGFPGLKNDSRVVVRGMMRMRVAAIEVHRVLDGEFVEAIDLLDGRDAVPLRVRDRSFASRASRFTSMLTWIYPMPDHWRLSGMGIMIAGMGDLDPGEVVVEQARHLGAPPDTAGLRGWLAANFKRFDEGHTSTLDARRRKMIEESDCHFGKAVYELAETPGRCRAELDRGARVEPDDLDRDERADGFEEARVWFDDDEATAGATPEGGHPVLGRILMGPHGWRIEAMGRERMAKFRALFEKRMGSRVRFVAERIDDLGARLGGGSPKGDPSLVPPRLLQDSARVALQTSRVEQSDPPLSPGAMRAAMFEASNRAFPDQAIPALGGKTPREAVGDMLLRPRLIQLVKDRVKSQDEENLRSGRADDINWLVRELGLHEIDFEPPPRRHPPEAGDDGHEGEFPIYDEFAEQGGEDWEPPDYSGLPLPPELPEGHISFEEADERIQRALELTRGDAGLEAFEIAGDEIIGFVEDTGVIEEMSEDERGLFMVTLVSAWFIFVPPGCRPPSLDYDGMASDFVENARRFKACFSRGPDAMGREFLRDSRQPEVLALLMGQITSAIQGEANRPPPSGQATVIMLAMLKTVIDELDQALRA